MRFSSIGLLYGVYVRSTIDFSSFSAIMAHTADVADILKSGSHVEDRLLLYWRGIPCVRRRPLTGTPIRPELPRNTLKRSEWIEPSLYRTNKHDYSYLWMLRNRLDVCVKRSRI